MLFSLGSILLASATLLGQVFSAPLEGGDNLIHEYITREDGTVDHFAYHISFVPSADIQLEVNDTAVGITSNLSTALKNGGNPEGLATALNKVSMPDHIKRLLALNMDSNATSNSAAPGSDHSDVAEPDERLDKPFVGSDSYTNASFCGFNSPFPDWNIGDFLKRPDTYDCTRLLEMWSLRPGYYQLTQFGGSTPTDWSALTLYNSCKMNVRRLDLDNQWGARVGSFDIMLWVGAAILVSVGKEFENPTVIKYMASISGSLGCQEIGPNPIALLEFELARNGDSPQPTGSQATQTPTLAPLPSALSSSLTHSTPTSFPPVVQARLATSAVSQTPAGRPKTVGRWV